MTVIVALRSLEPVARRLSIATATKSTISSGTMLQLSNIAWELNRELQLDPNNAHILNDPKAMAMWGREYEQGWAPHT